MRLSHKILSITLIIINILLILYFYFFANQGYLEGAPGWILGVIGAPVTFILFIFFKLSPKLFPSILSQYMMISFLFQLQYQSILYFLFKAKLKSITQKILVFIIIAVLVFISVKEMRKIVLPTLDEMASGVYRSEKAKVMKLFEFLPRLY